MTVGIVMNSLAGGGAERVLLAIAAHLTENGDDVVLLPLDSQQSTFSIPADVKVRSLFAVAPARILQMPFHMLAAYRLARSMDRFKIDVVLAALPRANIVSCLAKQFHSRTRVVVSERTVPHLRYSSKSAGDMLMRKSIRWAYNRADAIIAISSLSAQSLRELGVNVPVTVINNPVLRADKMHSEGLRPPESSSGTRVGTLCRLVPEKNVSMLVEAFAGADLPNDSRLIIGGDGNHRLTLEDQVDRCGISHSTHFEGWTKTPSQFIDNLDIYVCTSLWEGFGNACAEAMAAGKAVVVTDVTGIGVDLIVDGVSGCLVASGDVSGLRRILEHLASNQERRRSIGDKAQLAVRHLSLGNVASQYRRVLVG